MNIDFKLPELGENVENGDVVKVLVQEGQMIAANDGVVELETDKAVVEIPCPHAGKVTKIHVKKGDTVNVGQTLLALEAESAEQEAEAPSPTAEPGQPGEPPGLSRREPARGQAPRLASSLPPRLASSLPPRLASGLPTAEPLPAGPATRRLARQLGVDLRQVAGSGQRGRITPDDVKAAVSKVSAPGKTVSVGAPEPVALPGEPGEDFWGPIRRERMPKIRRTIAAQMVKSAATIPHVTNFDDADVTELEHLRKSIPPGYLGGNVKLTAMPFLMKAVALALRRHPMLNASLDEDDEQVIYKQYVNLGVAVDTPRGLVVPAIRHVDRMSIPQIARELMTLAKRARTADFAIEDLRGGTFTISNLGAVGGSYSTPIINHPEVAILLLGRSRWTPVIRQEQVERRLMMPLSLSFDHRLVDGAAAGRFLNEVIDFLQSPGKLLLAE